MNRRQFLQQTAVAAGALALPGSDRPESRSLFHNREPLFKISLAQWSLHRALRKGTLDNLDFARTAREDFGIDAVEYVNQFFKSHGQDQKYLSQMKKRAQDAGVRSVLIMVDGEGRLGDADQKRRIQAVERHKQWVSAARFLGCHSVRVNAYSAGSPAEQRKRAADGLARLAHFAEPFGLNVIVENHGGLSSNGRWLASVMKSVKLKNCGTLPDFGNFKISSKEEYDRYQGVRELMPWARGVSAKTYDFDAQGRETLIDYGRMLKIVVDAGYHGRLGIEYEGTRLSEPAGIRATLRLLKKVRAELTKKR